MKIMDIAMWLILAAVAVLVIMNAKNAATVLSAGFSGVDNTLTVLTGSGYKMAS